MSNRSVGYLAIVICMVAIVGCLVWIAPRALERAFGRSYALQVYFSNAEKDPQMLMCDSVYSTIRHVVRSDGTKMPAEDLARMALSFLLGGPSTSQRAVGFVSNIPDGTTLKGFTISPDGVIDVTFSSEFMQGMAGSCRVIAVRAQIEETLKSSLRSADIEVKEVRIHVEGFADEEVLQP